MASGPSRREPAKGRSASTSGILSVNAEGQVVGVKGIAPKWGTTTASPRVETEPLPKPKSRKSIIAIRMCLWATFGVVFGLGPVIANSIKSGMSAHGLNLTEVLGHGELFIVGAVIAGSAVGELVAAFLAQDFSAKATGFKVSAIFAGFGALLAVFANTAGYMTQADPLTVRDASEWFFVLTLVPCGAIIGMVAGP